MTNSNLLKARIKEKGLIQSTVARKIGISATSLSNKLNGQTEFKVTEIEKLCDLLEIENKNPYFFA